MKIGFDFGSESIHYVVLDDNKIIKTEYVAKESGRNQVVF